MSGLDEPCPRCGARAGQTCTNSKGQGKAPCPERGGATNWRHAASAARRNARDADDLPLFAALLTPHTAATEHQRVRFGAARGVELSAALAGGRLLDALTYYQKLLPLARSLLDEDAFLRLHAYCQRVYPSAPYWLSFWRRALTGERVELDWVRAADEVRTPGEPALRCVFAHEQPVLTRAAFDALFPDQHEPTVGGESPALPLQPGSPP